MLLRWLRYAWALPVSVLGVLIAVIARGSGGSLQRVEGVIESAGGWPARVLNRGFPFSGAVAAITLGHVVVAVSQDALNATRAHERAHVRQFERWGVLLLALYPLAGVVVLLRGGNPYRDNPFEREARAAESGRRNETGALCSDGIHSAKR